MSYYPPSGGANEGEYSNYVLVWDTPKPVLLTTMYVVMISNNSPYAELYDAVGNGKWLFDLRTGVLADTGYVGAFTPIAQYFQSAGHAYNVNVDNVTQELNIFRRGVLLQTIPLDNPLDLGFTLGGISPNAKFIIAYYQAGVGVFSCRLYRGQ